MVCFIVNTIFLKFEKTRCSYRVCYCCICEFESVLTIKHMFGWFLTRNGFSREHVHLYNDVAIEMGQDCYTLVIIFTIAIR